MRYSEWFRNCRKAEKAYRAACKRGAARLNNPDPISGRLVSCARACDKAYLRWVRETLKDVTAD